jgi:hypothetical protein
MNGAKYYPDHALSRLRSLYGDPLLLEAFDQCGATPNCYDPDTIIDYCETMEAAYC